METVILVCSTLLFLSGLAAVYWTHGQYRMEIVVPPDPPPLEGDPPCISVVVPARNEERNIRRCVQALLDQSYPDYELIVVDDRSTDATARILAELERAHPGKLRILQGSEPPPGWAGKPHALAQGVRYASGGWLCFIDADTFAEQQLLQATCTTARRHGADMFSMLTKQELESFWEKTILPLVFTALSVGFPASRVNDPDRPEAIANGQFILIRRAVYEAVGGHAAVKGEIAEDKALAERVKHAGFRLLIGDGRSAASTRMYTGFSEIWEGWTKNIFLGMQGRLGLLLLGAVLGLIAGLLPAWLAGSLAWYLTGGGPVAGVAAAEILLLWAYLLFQRVRASLAFQISPLYALTFPVGALVFTGMMITSAYNVLSGRGVTWKGRRYTHPD